MLDLPGHAPGLIGLFRERRTGSRWSPTCFYTLESGDRPRGPRRTCPHPAFNLDTDQARESIRQLAALDP